MSFKAWTLVVCFAVNLYLLGVMVLFAAVVYPGFGAVGREAFPPLYAAFTARIGAPVVLFELAALVSTLPLYAARPAAAPLAAVHALVALGVLYFAITFGWHLPEHRALAAGDNGAAALGPLLQSQWARTGVQLARAGVLCWLGARATVGPA
jgi:hypothetical protein